MLRKGGAELFEVLRAGAARLRRRPVARGESEERPQAKAKPAEAAGPLKFAQGRSVPAAKEKAPAQPFRIDLGRKPKFIFSLSAAALAVVIIAALAVAGALFLVGTRYGVAPAAPETMKRLSEEGQLLKQIEPVEMPPSPVEPGRTAGGFYSVQVVTYAASKKAFAERLVSALSQRGMDAFARETSGGKYIVVYAGRFSSRNDPELVSLLERIRGLRINGEPVKDAAIRLVE